MIKFKEREKEAINLYSSHSPPIRIELKGETKAQGAVIDTNPPNKALKLSLISY